MVESPTYFQAFNPGNNFKALLVKQNTERSWFCFLILLHIALVSGRLSRSTITGITIREKFNKLTPWSGPFL